MITCDVCGKSLQNPENGSCLIGIGISVNAETEASKDYYQKQLGKYKLGKAYNICFECWLKSLGAKP